MIVMRVLRVPGEHRVLVASEATAAELELHRWAERLDRDPDPDHPQLRPPRDTHRV